MKNLLSGPIDALIQDSSTVKQILDEVNSQLPVSLQVKLLPAGYLPSFRAKVAEARHRIETRHSQSLLRTIIAEMCQSVNKKKAALDAKVEISASAQRLHLLERELEDLEAKVRATKQRIQEEKDLIAGSKQEAAVAEPLELFQLKCVNDRYTAVIKSTHFKRNNPLVCRVSARYNHGSTGSRQIYLARRRVYNHRIAHQLLIHRHSNIITN
jgi:uncharacterized protein YeeX (DUF496 family)